MCVICSHIVQPRFQILWLNVSLGKLIIQSSESFRFSLNNAANKPATKGPLTSRTATILATMEAGSASAAKAGAAIGIKEPNAAATRKVVARNAFTVPSCRMILSRLSISKLEYYIG